MTIKRSGAGWKAGFAAALLLASAGVGLGQQQPAPRVQENQFQPADGDQFQGESQQQPLPESKAPAAPQQMFPAQMAPAPTVPKPVAARPAFRRPARRPPARTPRPPVYDRTRWDREGVRNLFWGRPSGLRISVLNGSGNPLRGRIVTALLNEYHRDRLERTIGQKIVVVNASDIPAKKGEKSVILYRPGFIRAAMMVADAIPGQQAVAPMKLQRRSKIGIDLEIRLAKDSR